MKRNWLSTVRSCCVMLLLATTSAHGQDPYNPGVIGADDRTPIMAPMDAALAVGRINREIGGFCTGVLIAPDEVLTSAHCLWFGRRQAWLAPAAVHFLAGYRRGSYAAHGRARAFILPDNLQVNRDGLPRTLSDDWAVIQLREPIAADSGIHPLPLAGPIERERAVEGSSLARIGYGRDRPHLPVMVDPCTSLGFADRGRILLHDCDATFGDSGSPILLHQADGYVVLGIQSAVVRSNDKAVGAAVLLSRVLPVDVLKPHDDR